MLFGESPGSQVGKAATHPLHLPLFLDASNYAREGLGSKMLGARGSKRQCDIAKFDVAPETVQRALISLVSVFCSAFSSLLRLLPRTVIDDCGIDSGAAKALGLRQPSGAVCCRHADPRRAVKAARRIADIRQSGVLSSKNLFGVCSNRLF